MHGLMYVALLDSILYGYIFMDDLILFHFIGNSFDVNRLKRALMLIYFLHTMEKNCPQKGEPKTQMPIALFLIYGNIKSIQTLFFIL